MRIEIQKFHHTSLSPISVSLNIQIFVNLCSSSLSGGSFRELARSHLYTVKIDVPSSYRDRGTEQLVGMLLSLRRQVVAGGGASLFS